MSQKSLVRVARGGAAQGFALLLATNAHAAINISAQPTQNMSCSTGVCTATAQKAYLNVNDVTNFLAAGDLKIVSGAGAEDIHIQAPFSWTSTSRLTLDAQRSIEFEKPVSVAGTGALTLITNDGDTGGDYWFDAGASVTFWDTSSSLIINGASFTLVKDINTLAAAIAANPYGNFALANNYDASADGTYKQSPINTGVLGTMEGLGNTISNLSLKNTNIQTQIYLGLFGGLGQEGALRDLNISKGKVTADVAKYSNAAMLVAYSEGLIAHCYAQGKVSGREVVIVGGLVGTNLGIISNSGTTAKVSAGPDGWAGGLVGSDGVPGQRAVGSIIQSFSHGEIDMVGPSAEGMEVGGLVGLGGQIDRSFSTTKVVAQGEVMAGGLVGSGDVITNSHATGSVTVLGDTNVGLAGGLVGETCCSQTPAIVNSYATGAVNVGKNSWGAGLVGRAGAPITSSFATGSVTAAGGGGLVGILAYNKSDEFGSVTKSYSTGNITTSASFTGGAIGDKEDWHSRVSQVYSLGAVRAQSGSVGGFLGADYQNPRRQHRISDAYWDLDTSGISDPGQGAGNIPNDPGITGLSDAQLKSELPAGFDPAVWGHRRASTTAIPICSPTRRPRMGLRKPVPHLLLALRIAIPRNASPVLTLNLLFGRRDAYASRSRRRRRRSCRTASVRTRKRSRRATSPTTRPVSRATIGTRPMSAAAMRSASWPASSSS